MDNTKKFDGIANEYTQSRPSYAAEFIECLFGKYGFSASSVVADIGSGTGKFAKQLIDKGSNVLFVLSRTLICDLWLKKNYVNILTLNLL